MRAATPTTLFGIRRPVMAGSGSHSALAGGRCESMLSHAALAVDDGTGPRPVEGARAVCSVRARRFVAYAAVTATSTQYGGPARAPRWGDHAPPVLAGGLAGSPRRMSPRAACEAETVFGGGTPTMLDTAKLAEILTACVSASRPARGDPRGQSPIDATRGTGSGSLSRVLRGLWHAVCGPRDSQLPVAPTRPSGASSSSGRSSARSYLVDLTRGTARGEPRRLGDAIPARRPGSTEIDHIALTPVEEGTKMGRRWPESCRSPDPDGGGR